ncbi:MAG: hypothetical protein JEZ14_17095 [Marinilabiliaceae bacterium]|nr:hypothetical protein [Marinilabiliaceae bacterium]
MTSVKLSKTLNSFYDELIDSLFKTETEICSFLTGVFYRYGEKLDSTIYKIQLANSPKHQDCYELLKRIGCTKILYKYLRNIPAQYILYFEPTFALKSYLDSIEPQIHLLNKEYTFQIKQVEVQYLKQKDKERVNIRNAFY